MAAAIGHQLKRLTTFARRQFLARLATSRTGVVQRRQATGGTCLRHNAPMDLVRMARMKLICRIVVSGVLAAAAAAPTLAALGGDSQSVRSDGLSMKSAVRVTLSNGFAVHELAGPSGSVLREFLGADGKVFAVA